MTAIFLLTMLFVLLFIGVPVAVSLGFASVLTMLLFGDQSLLSSAQKFFHTMHVYPLLAVPFFILAGAFMTTGGVARRMIDFANALVGHFRGGLAMAALLGSAFFCRRIGIGAGDGRRRWQRHDRRHGGVGLLERLCSRRNL